jgi:RNA polymerase primary sigma factor
MVSLDQTIYDDDVTLAETLVDPEDLNPEDGFVTNELQMEMSEALDLLSPRERDIVMRYYGLGDQETSSLEAIGQDIKLSRERVRQIRNQALKKIRQAVNGEKLVDFLG